MLNWTLNFFILALVAAAFGFGGIAAEAVALGQICFALFLVLFLVSALVGRRLISPD